MRKPTKLAENLYLIDDHDLNFTERTGTYILTERDLTIIETCASPSVPHIIQGLNLLGYSLEELTNIIVTHIHLDHAGGAGLLLNSCPNATIIVHPKGKKHLVNPDRLINGARAVYQDKFESLFDPIVPIPEERLMIMEDNGELNIGENCTLTFFDTPGHANHHFSIFHSNVKGIFTGDTAGVHYPQLLKNGIELYLPSTSPNQFHPQKMLESIHLYKSLNPTSIYFGHYGKSDHPDEVFLQVSAWLDVFVGLAKDAYSEGDSFQERVQLAEKKLFDTVYRFLEKKGVKPTHKVFEIIQLDMGVCAMGLIDYLDKEKEAKL